MPRVRIDARHKKTPPMCRRCIRARAAADGLCEPCRALGAHDVSGDHQAVLDQRTRLRALQDAGAHPRTDDPEADARFAVRAAWEPTCQDLASLLDPSARVRIDPWKKKAKKSRK